MDFLAWFVSNTLFSHVMIHLTISTFHLMQLSGYYICIHLRGEKRLSCLPDRSDGHRWSQERASRWGCRGEDLQSEGGHRRPGKLVDEALAPHFRVAWIDPDSELVRSQGSNWKKAYVPHQLMLGMSHPTV